MGFAFVFSLYSVTWHSLLEPAIINSHVINRAIM